jgi:hypothetical protein
MNSWKRRIKFCQIVSNSFGLLQPDKIEGDREIQDGDRCSF